jgi:bifunctional DNase/RNase
VVRMELRSIHVNDTADRQYITLAEKLDAEAPEAKGVRPPRPLTHELLASVVDASGAVLDRVDVTELKEGTFYAVLRLTRADGSAVDVDARPSDALALATALGKPIYVAEAVIEAARED